ncbi:MAG: ABC transporter permease subunit [Deinococcus sp.]|nr:ABC transporter permease subunit [Deinococcus sp.]
MRSRFQGALGLALVLPSIAVLVLLVVWPAILAVIRSITFVQDGQTIWSTERYVQIFTRPVLYNDIFFTAYVTIISVLGVLLIAYPAALYFRFARGRPVNLFSTIYMLPLFVPGIIAVYALVRFLSERGWLWSLLTFLGVKNIPYISYTATGIILAQIWTHLPFSTLILQSGLQAVSDDMVESARDVGASWFRILWSILLPLNLRSTVIALTILGIGVIGSFTIPFLSGPSAPRMLGVTTFSYLTTFFQPEMAAALAVTLFGMSLLLSVVYIVVISRKERT